MYQSCGHDGWELSHKTAAGYDREGSYARHKQSTKQEVGSGTQLQPRSLDDLLHRFPCCPPEAFYNIKEFYDNPFLNKLDDNCKAIRVSLRNFCSRIREWTIFDFNQYYSQTNVTPYFNAYSRDCKSIYYTLDESVRIANELLDYQFENDTDAIKVFLRNLYEVVDKIIPKRNSLAILSPPSAGKNFFMDAVASYFLNYGMFGTANKTNNFSWADGAGKRLVLWNEPNYETYHVEKIKELLGGDTTRIHVKYKGDQPLQGPPIIILTNNHLNIMNDDAFRDRLITYTWRSAPFLKQYNKKLLPTFFYKILLYWDIIN